MIQRLNDLLAAEAVSTTATAEQPSPLLHNCHSGMIDKVFLSVQKHNVERSRTTVTVLSLFEQSNISQF